MRRAERCRPRIFSASSGSGEPDIAGVRIVIDGDRLEQDRVVERIRGLFPDTRTIDRRAVPSHGYRAVHVIVRTQGCLVEVQVRTRMQDMWAQTVERLADTIGRQIRYGEQPTDPDKLVARGGYKAGLSRLSDDHGADDQP